MIIKNINFTLMPPDIFFDGAHVCAAINLLVKLGVIEMSDWQQNQ